MNANLLVELLERLESAKQYSCDESPAALVVVRANIAAAQKIGETLLEEERQLEALFADDEFAESLFDSDCQALETDLEELGAGIESLKVAMEARERRRPGFDRRIADRHCVCGARECVCGFATIAGKVAL